MAEIVREENIRGNDAQLRMHLIDTISNRPDGTQFFLFAFTPVTESGNTVTMEPTVECCGPYLADGARLARAVEVLAEKGWLR